MYWLFAAILIGAYLLRGLVLACIIPPFEMWDEYNHLANIHVVAETGKSPVFGASSVPPAVLRGMVKYPQCDFAMQQVWGTGAKSYADFWQLDKPPVYFEGCGPLDLYESQHPPLYYHLAALIYKALGGAAQIGRSISGLRLLNVLISACGLSAILIWLGKNCRDRRNAALIALWIIFQPLFLLNADRVANDALAVTLGCFAVVWAMSLGTRRILWQAGGLGLLVGLGILAKATDFVLLPFVEICFLLLALRKQITWRQFFQISAIFVLATAAVTEEYFRFNLQHFGVLTPMQEAVHNKANGRKWADYAKYLPLSMDRLTLWPWAYKYWIFDHGLWQGGWSFLYPRGYFVLAYSLLLPISLVGWPFAWFFRQTERKPGDVFLCQDVALKILALGAAMLAAMTYHALQALADVGVISTQAYYGELVIPWLMILIASSGLAYRHGRGGWPGYTLSLSVPVLFIVTEAYGVFLQMIPHYTMLGLGSKALARIALLHPPELNTRTLLIALVVNTVLIILAGWLLWRAFAAGRTHTQVPEVDVQDVDKSSAPVTVAPQAG
jgi:4-amino-4-deoxy-L-arabinose transferase-like glycosyltransferase